MAANSDMRQVSEGQRVISAVIETCSDAMNRRPNLAFMTPCAVQIKKAIIARLPAAALKNGIPRNLIFAGLCDRSVDFFTWSA